MTIQQLNNDERQAFADSVRAACEQRLTEERLRQIAFVVQGSQRGFDAELWRTLCEQLGVGTMALPEEHGGAGYGVAALGVVAHETGRTLAPVPLVPFVLSCGLLLDLASAELLGRVMPALTSGDRTAAVVLTPDAGIWDPTSVPMTAHAKDDRWLIDGDARHVWHAPAADRLVVVAMTADGVGLFLLDAAAEGVHVQPESTLDGTRPMGTVTVHRARGVRIDQTDTGVDVLAAVQRNVIRALAVLVAEQVGACERVLEIATEYARTRTQFGRAIGSFQAIKHKCADVLVDLEFSRSASQAALLSIDDADGNADWLASMAKAVCSKALRSAAHANVQIHGGIGFTWEDSAHLYLKRARTDEVIFGGPGAHWDRVAPRAGTSLTS